LEAARFVDLATDRRTAKGEEDLVFGEGLRTSTARERGEGVILGDDQDEVLTEYVDARSFGGVDRRPHGEVGVEPFTNCGSMTEFVPSTMCRAIWG